MTAQRFCCPAAPYVHPCDRHLVTNRRWVLTDSVGVETIVCGLAWVIGADRRETGNGAAA
jgi:hypothetical protein